MGETEILERLFVDLNVGTWWEDLLGQKPSTENFDIQLAIDTIPRTEYSAAAEINRKFKNILTYSERVKTWYIWDGRIHTPCGGDGIVIKIIKYFYRALVNALDYVKEYYEREARKIQSSGVEKADEKAKAIRQKYDKGEISKHKMYRDRVATDAGMTAISRVLRTESDVPENYYDNDQQWFVVRNGVFDLHEMAEGKIVLLNHNSSRPVTKFFDAEWDKDTNLGHWDSFLERSIPNKEMRDHLHIVTGASFMGLSKLRTIINLYGPPGSGKSVYLDTLHKLGKGGAGYTCLPDSKVAIRISGTNFDQDSLRGRRFYGISEPSSKDDFDDDFFKKLTGDSVVETRTLNAKSDGWTPQGIPFIASNAALRINARDKAISERVQMVNFPVEFKFEPDETLRMHIPEEKRAIVGLEQLLVDDSSRILTWIIIGMWTFVTEHKMKIKAPKSMLQLQGDVVVNGSTALRWVEDFIDEGMITCDGEANARFSLPVKDAYQIYQQWIVSVGERRALTLRFFAEDIEKKYGDRVREGVYRFPQLLPTIDYRRKYDTAAFSFMNEEPK